MLFQKRYQLTSSDSFFSSTLSEPGMRPAVRDLKKCGGEYESHQSALFPVNYQDDAYYCKNLSRFSNDLTTSGRLWEPAKAIRTQKRLLFA